MLAVVVRSAAAHFVKATTLLMYDDVVAFQNKQRNKKKASFKPRLDYFSTPRDGNPSEEHTSAACVRLDRSVVEVCRWFTCSLRELDQALLNLFM